MWGEMAADKSAWIKPCKIHFHFTDNKVNL